MSQPEERTHDGVIATCQREATLGYPYDDPWLTNIHKSAWTDDPATRGFVTGKPEYLVGGSGRTAAATAAGEKNTKYDARIYSHFNMGAIQVTVGAPSTDDRDGHKRRDAEKRRFLARALELEIYLYVDSLRFWALATFDVLRPRAKNNCGSSKDAPTPLTQSANAHTPHAATDPNAHNQLESWLGDKRRFWSDILATRQDPKPAEPAPKGNGSWWTWKDALHQIYESFSHGTINKMETTLPTLLELVAERGLGLDPNKLLESKLFRDQSNRFWAEGLCETVRETTLVPTVFPQLMEALICNIPAGVWKIASPEISDMPLRVLARAATSLVCKLDKELRSDSGTTQEEQLKALLDSFRLPSKQPDPGYLQDIHELIDRIENINDLIALHAAALHHCFQNPPEPVKIESGDKANLKPRDVDGVRPRLPTRLLCFKSPGMSKETTKPDGKRDGPCPPEGCDTCFKNRCSLLPCESDKCHETATGNREFVRQLREQQAALNGTSTKQLQANRNLVKPPNDPTRDTSAGATDPLASTTAQTGRGASNASDGGTDLVRDEKAQRRAARLWLALRTKQLMDDRKLSESDAEAVALKERSSELTTIERSFREAAVKKRFSELKENHPEISDSALMKRARRQLREENKIKLSAKASALATQHPNMNEEERRRLARMAIREEAIGDLLESGSGYEGLAALHALDIIAGGHAVQLLGMGDGSVNSAIGRQWTSTPGKKLAEALASKPGHEGEIYPNFELVVCPPKCTLNEPQTESTTP